MKRNLKITATILSLIVLLIPITYAYAIELTEKNNNEIDFFEISKLEVTKNDTIEMTINIDQIKYNKSIFVLTSNEEIDNIEAEDEVKVETSGNEISIEIDKETSNLSKIILYYEVPKNKQVNDTIEFIAIITNAENEEEQETVEIEITIVEENDEDEENQQVDNVDYSQMANDEKVTSQVETFSNVRQSGTNTTSVNSQNTVTYNGSDNNYLSELIVGDYTLNREFSKENTTYFMTIDSDVNELDITATAEDSSATICIYGNEDLSEGTNKILISVTAENGNVRSYRIYVTKSA